MATVAQGQLAGQLATQITGLQALGAQLQTAVTNNAQITGLSFIAGSIPGAFSQSVTFSAADSATLLNAAIGIINNNIVALTTQLTAL